MKDFTKISYENCDIYIVNLDLFDPDPTHISQMDNFAGSLIF